jgi:type II secretory ATPase GspE/PulE/Tfp pilus assembly ATPase PilB-like protein
MGRLGVFELLNVSDSLRSQIVRSPDVQSMRSVAKGEGMTTLRDDGLAKVLAGETTVEEVLRAIQA